MELVWHKQNKKIKYYVEWCKPIERQNAMKNLSNDFAKRIAL